MSVQMQTIKPKVQEATPAPTSPKGASVSQKVEAVQKRKNLFAYVREKQQVAKQAMEKKAKEQKEYFPLLYKGKIAF